MADALIVRCSISLIFLSFCVFSMFLTKNLEIEDDSDWLDLLLEFLRELRLANLLSLY